MTLLLEVKLSEFSQNTSVPVEFKTLFHYEYIELWLYKFSGVK